MTNKNLFDFACEHPVITWFIASALISAPANIIRAIKGESPREPINITLTKREPIEQVKESE